MGDDTEQKEISPSLDLLGKDSLPAIDDSLYAEIAGAHCPRSNPKWTPEQKIMAATYYAVLGSYEKTSQHMRAEGSPVPISTIAYWRRKSKWWPLVIQKAQKLHDDRLEAKMTRIIHTAADQTLDRLQKGDCRLQGDKIKRVPVTARDATIVAGTWYDKRALKRGDVTSRTESITPEESLRRLADRFAEMAKGARGETIEAVKTEYYTDKRPE